MGQLREDATTFQAFQLGPDSDSRRSYQYYCHNWSRQPSLKGGCLLSLGKEVVSSPNCCSGSSWPPSEERTAVHFLCSQHLNSCSTKAKVRKLACLQINTS